MRFPDGPYSGSTFWTMSQNGNNSVPFGDPAADGPELDIVEHANKAIDDEADGEDSDGDLNDDGICDWPTHLGVPCSETLLSGGHWDGFEEDHKVNHTTAVKNPGYDPGNATATSLQDNFHTYGMLWTPSGYTFYVDGQETYRVATGTSYTPQHLILATYVYPPSGGFPAGFTYGPKGAVTNDVTLVDYVRVWQRPVAEIPDIDAVAGRPVALPFTVADHFSSSTSRAEPGSVRVTATSSNQSVVPDSGITVTGNGPADPDGSFQNGTFEAGSSGWTFPSLAGGGTNNATVWSTRSHTPANALRLSEVNNSNQAGRAEQVVTGLQPNTTYVISGRYDLEIGYTDVNANGRIDPNEPFTEPGETESDGTAAVDWGVKDVDTSRSGAQPVTVRISRNGYTEAGYARGGDPTSGSRSSSSSRPGRRPRPSPCSSPTMPTRRSRKTPTSPSTPSRSDRSSRRSAASPSFRPVMRKGRPRSPSPPPTQPVRSWEPSRSRSTFVGARRSRTAASSSRTWAAGGPSPTATA